MSLLPTAHAGQTYGSRRVDFFTVSGQVSASDAHIGRITDTDGMDHDVKLTEQSSAFAPGDSATILRIQSGPNRRSRPVAIINHSRGVWMRAAPDATSTLARSGVTRTFNWWLSILFLALVAIASVWPLMHTFLTEINRSMMASVPSFDIYADLTAQFPALTGWRLESGLSTGLSDALTSLGFVPMNLLTEIGVFSLAGLMALLSFSARSWRLIYVPALAVGAVIAGAIFGGAEATLAIIGASIALFMLGGFINRVRDSGRLNSRVEQLAEHVLRNPPFEEVRTAPATAIAAAGATLAVSQPETSAASAVAEPELAEMPAEPIAEPAPEAAPVEVEAVEAEAETEDATEAETAAEIEEPVLAEAAAGSEATESSEESDAEETPEPVEAAAVESEVEDDDLPSMEEVAAAAALNQQEQAKAEGSEAVETVSEAVAVEDQSVTLEDDRALAVAPPPPMPTAAEPAPVETETEPAVVAEEAPVEMDTPPADPVAEHTETELCVPVDDPLIDDDHDPMMDEAGSADFAPGAPEIELEDERQS
ncbi:hypothetical protein [Maricaulis sp.]|uniref:hypothetical protein n=1 Tax=Maricaulis sp. TaxID=1486257 RepID=UPI0026275C65|nr:hypothetical protein [Maricaulis sp.]